jgi:hypothetical protein
VRPPETPIKSVTFSSDVTGSLPTIGTCTQNKARNGVHFRAKSVQRVRAMFSQDFGAVRI